MDKVLDKFERLAWDATYAVCILGNPESRDFELVDIGPKPLTEERRRKMSERGLGFLGVLGIVGGVPRAALAVELDPVTQSALVQSFLQRIEDAINTVEKAAKGDSAEFLQRLYKIPDNRSEMN